jgi:hypothetical protein
MGTVDLTDVRAKIVQKLNSNRIPVVAWLLLPKDQGYWMNMDNYLNVIQRYNEVTIIVKEQKFGTLIELKCFSSKVGLRNTT